MSDQIWGALIGAIALLAAGYFGYALRGRAQRLAEKRETLQAQLDQVYGPIYYLLKDAVPLDEPLSGIEEDDVERIIRIARAKRKFLEPRLESIIDFLKEDLWMHGEVDERDLDALWRHVNHKYNNLKKVLGLPHTHHRATRSLPNLFKLVRSWWSAYSWEREMKRKKRGSRRAHRLE